MKRGECGLTTPYVDPTGPWGRILRFMCLFAKHDPVCVRTDVAPPIKGQRAEIQRKVYRCTRCGEVWDAWEVAP